MYRKPLTKRVMRRVIHKKDMLLLILSLFFFTIAASYLLTMIEDLNSAKDSYARHLIWTNWENLGAVIALAIAATSLYFWIRNQLRDRENRICFGSCVKKKEELFDDQTQYYLDVAADNGKTKRLDLDWKDYENVKQGDRMYVLVNPKEEILFAWSARYYGLSEDLLPLMSESDRQRERSWRTETLQDRADKPIKQDPTQKARDRGDETPEDTKAKGTNRVVIGCVLAVLLLISAVVPWAVLGAAWLIIMGMPLHPTKTDDEIFISKAYGKARNEEGLLDPLKIQQSVRMQLRKRRLLHCGQTFLLGIAVTAICFVVGSAAKNEPLFPVTGLAFLILTLERLGSALVGELKPHEEMQLMHLLQD